MSEPHLLRRLKTALVLAVALASSCHQPITAERRALSAAAPRSAAVAGTTFTVELLGSIDSDVPNAPFAAETLGPILTAGGATVVKSGAAVTGRAIGVPGPTGSSLRLELDSIETVHGTTKLSATLAPRQRDDALAATDVQGPGPGYDALIGPPPVAAPRPREIGGGPPEEPTAATPPPEAWPPEPEREAEPYRFPPIRLHRRDRLDLMLTQPLSAPAATSGR
jgi:hypothetical protein